MRTIISLILHKVKRMNLLTIVIMVAQPEGNSECLRLNIQMYLDGLMINGSQGLVRLILVSFFIQILVFYNSI